MEDLCGKFVKPLMLIVGTLLSTARMTLVNVRSVPGWGTCWRRWQQAGWMGRRPRRATQEGDAPGQGFWEICIIKAGAHCSFNATHPEAVIHACMSKFPIGCPSDKSMSWSFKNSAGKKWIWHWRMYSENRSKESIGATAWIGGKTQPGVNACWNLLMVVSEIEKWKDGSCTFKTMSYTQEWCLHWDMISCRRGKMSREMHWIWQWRELQLCWERLHHFHAKHCESCSGMHDRRDKHFPVVWLTWS